MRQTDGKNYLFKRQNSLYKCQNSLYECQNSLYECQNSLYECQFSNATDHGATEALACEVDHGAQLRWKGHLGANPNPPEKTHDFRQSIKRHFLCQRFAARIEVSIIVLSGGFVGLYILPSS